MKRLIARLTGRNLTIVFILLPTLVSAAYLYLLAADRYVSEAQVTVKQSGEQALGLGGLASIFQVTGVNARTDLTLLQAHIQSMDMLKVLDARLHLRQAFSAPRADLLLRLAPDATDDDFLAYYRSRVEARFDDNSGLLVLRAQGFTPEQAQSINQVIIEASERFINQISQHLAQDQMQFAKNEMATVTQKYELAKRSMMAFQERHHVLDPSAQARANSELTMELQARLTRLEADLRAAQAYMDDNSFQVRFLKQQIDAARGQMGAEAARGTSDTQSGQRLNNLVADFRELEMQVNLAEQGYKAAIITMETARLESTRKIKSLVLIATPTKPQKPEYPRRWYDLLSLLLGFCLVFGIVKLLVVTIEDHID